ncbi:MAG: hypothetical protein BalsKO_11250 [Balneolaceae bacterium]
MEASSLTELYSQVNKHFSKVFVVPLIRYNFPKTDYLYLLYKDLLTQPDKPEIKSICVFNHYKFVLEPILTKNTILHYHWLEFQNAKALLGMPYKLLCIALYWLLGGTIIWTVHNLSPHDKKYLKLHEIIHRWMARRATVLHVHSPTAVSIVAKYLAIEKDKIVVLRHPTFPAEELNKEEAQKEFLSNYGDGKKILKSPVFLIFGGISEYKGIREIIEILSSQEQVFSLIIAGYVKVGQEELHNFIINKTIDDPRVTYVPSFIPEEHYPHLFHSSDICVFNYDEILTSGGIEMALAYQKKIIAPNLGGLKDLEKESNVSLFDSKEELKKKIYETLSHTENG